MLYGGHPDGCKKFMLACKLYFSAFPEVTSADKVRFLVKCLTGRFQEWATAIWSHNLQLTTSYKAFLRQFQAVFDHPGRTSKQRQLSVQQCSFTVAEYALDFQIVAADSGWDEPALLAVFCHGHNLVLQTELACCDQGRHVNSLIALDIVLDQHIRRNLVRSASGTSVNCWQ